MRCTIEKEKSQVTLNEEINTKEEIELKSVKLEPQSSDLEFKCKPIMDPYCCTLCKKSFCQPMDLQKHFEMNHSSNKLEVEKEKVITEYTAKYESDVNVDPELEIIDTSQISENCELQMPELQSRNERAHEIQSEIQCEIQMKPYNIPLRNELENTFQANQVDLNPKILNQKVEKDNKNYSKNENIDNTLLEKSRFIVVLSRTSQLACQLVTIRNKTDLC